MKTSSAVYEINYHIVWVPKYRKDVFKGKLKEFLEDTITTIAASKGFGITELMVMPDHIHLFISAPPKYSPTEIVKVMKGVTALRLFRKFPELKGKYWKGHIWSPSYYVGTHGHVTAEIIKKYIEDQKNV